MVDVANFSVPCVNLLISVSMASEILRHEIWIMITVSVAPFGTSKIAVSIVMGILVILHACRRPKK